LQRNLTEALPLKYIEVLPAAREFADFSARLRVLPLYESRVSLQRGAYCEENGLR